MTKELGTDITETLDLLFTQLAAAAGVDKDVLLDRIRESPEYNKWRIRKVKQATDGRYWIAAHPAKQVGRVFPRVMADGTPGHDAAKAYVEGQLTNTSCSVPPLGIEGSV